MTGQPPFQAEEPTTLFKLILLDEPNHPRALDATIHVDLETIALKCLEKNPEHRYSSAAEVAEELQRFLDGQPILALPISMSEKAMRWVQSNRSLTAALATVAMVVLGASLVLGQQQAENARQEKARVEAALANATRRKVAKAQAAVLDVLTRVRSGSLLEDPDDGAVARAKLLNFRDPATVLLLTAELDSLSKQLAESHTLNRDQELFLHFLCETLWNLGIREGAVASLARYLQTEHSLPASARKQLRAVPAGKALCLLGGVEADRLLLEAKRGFGADSAFWAQIQPIYIRTGIEPTLENETTEGYFKRGLIRQAKGNTAGAIADFNHVIEKDPTHLEAWIHHGLAQRASGNLDGAIADYSRAIEIDPNSATAWSSRGIARKTKGDLDGAIADLTHAIDINPNSTTAWSNRGIARKEKGNLDGAIADYSRAIVIDPNSATAWSNRGIARKEKGDLDGAIADLTHAIEINPNSSPAWSNRGATRQARGDLDGAIADLSNAINLDPRNSLAWVRRGNALQEQGNPPDAANDFNQAIKVSPEFADAWHSRGALRRLSGDLAGALGDSNKAISINPQNPIFWAGRGLAHHALGDLDGAIADGQRFLELAPQHPAAPSVRAEIVKMRQQQANTAAER